MSHSLRLRCCCWWWLVVAWSLVSAFVGEEAAFEAYNSAVRCHGLGDASCALAGYLQALTLKADFHQAHQNVAILYESGACDAATGGIAQSFEMARHHHRKAVEYAPSTIFAAGAWCNLVGLELRLINFPGQLVEVQYVTKREQGEQAVTTTSKNTRLLYFADQLEGILRQLQQQQDTDVGEVVNTSTLALFTLAKVLLEVQDYEGALEVFNRLLAADPQHSMALLNVGNHYFRQGDFELACEFYVKSIDVLQSRQEAPAARGGRNLENLVMALNNLGQAQRQLGLLDQAILTVEKALKCMREGDASNIDKGLELWSMNNVYAMRGLASHWGGNLEWTERFLEEAVELQGSQPLRFIAPSLSNGIVDPYTFSLHRFASRWSDLEANRIYCLPFSHSNIEKVSADLTHPRVVKIGYLSYDWRNHPMGRLTQRIVTSHNRSRFSATSVSYGPNDNSTVRVHVERHSQTFVDIEAVKNDHDASDAVKHLNLDVVVDLTSHTYNGRIAIAALKPAPLVINYLGYPGTTGCTGFDFSMVDKFVVPPEFARDLFSERLIYLPYSYQANHMPLTVPLCLSRDRKLCRFRTIEKGSSFYSTAASFSTWGSSEKVWLCSFNANKKIEPVAFAAWMNIMREHPRTVLILLDLEDTKRAKIYLEALHHGIATSRIAFLPNLPWRDHLHRSASCDLVLDTFVYGAHTTSSDVLWMSVPLLVLESWGSNRMPSRVAASISSSIYDASPSIYDKSNHGLSLTFSVKDYESTGRRILKRDNLQSFTFVFHGQIAAASLGAPTFGAAYMQECIETAVHGAVELDAIRKKAPVGQRQLYHLWLPPQRENSRQEDRRLQLSKKEAMQQIGDCMTRRAMIRKILTDDVASVPELPHPCRNADVHAIAGRLLASFPDISAAPLLRQIFTAFETATLMETECSAVSREFAFSLLSLSPDSPFLFLEKVEKCLLIQPVATIAPLLETQYNHVNRCADEDLLFTVISPLLFDRNIGWSGAYSHEILPTLTSSLPQVFNSTSTGWAYPSPVLVLADVPAQVNVKTLLAMFLSNHAVCSVQLGALETAAILLASSFVLDPAHNRMLDLGLIVDSFDPELGFRIASNASLLMHNERRRAVVVMPDVWPIVTRHHDKTRRRIAIYCFEYGNEWWGKWGPSSLETGGSGVGGSEEAVIYLSEELATMGYEVTIFANPPEKDLARGVINGVHYRHHTEYDVSDPVDVFVSWRYTFSLAMGRNARLSVLWLHDLVHANMLPPPFSEKLDVILVQSAFHLGRTVDSLLQRGHNEAATRQLLRILPNGISRRRRQEEEEEDVAPRKPNDRHTFVYGSSPTRGLEGLLKVWPLIHASIPNAKLRVFYGFPPSVQHQYRKQMGIERFEQWHSYMMDLLVKMPGVEYVGAVDHQTLTREYASAGFILYPTSFPETGCITLMKAMGCGAIPITSRYSHSVLPNLTSNHDLGPQQALRRDADLDKWLTEEFVPAVIQAAALDEEELAGRRRDMREHIRQHHLWSLSAKTFHDIITLRLI